MNYLLYIIIAITGYLIGSISFALIVGKFMFNTDVRKKGSGSAGATNVLRTLGTKAAIIVAAGDISKGVISYLIGYAIGKYAGNAQLGAVICGFGAVLGHNFPIFFSFKGGKGVLTTLAIAIMLDYRAALIAMVVVIAVILLTRYVSLGSMLGTITDTILIYAFSPDNTLKYITSIILSILIIIKHKDNIKRLLKGKESKIF